MKETITTKLETLRSDGQLLKEAISSLGLRGLITATVKDLFFGLSKIQWVYLLSLVSFPVLLELWTNGGAIKDWLGLLTSTTGIACVVYVAYGRASNYLFGTINALTYLILSLNASFYGEVITTVYFFVCQPIGLWMWSVNSLKNKDKAKNEKLQDVVVRKLDFKGWVKWILYTAAIWLGMGLAYQSIGSARPFRDSVTDGTNYTGQILMNGLYREQWIFWIATNLFSIYLWWGASLQVQAQYWMFTLNSIVGAILWFKQNKKGKRDA